MRLLRRNTTKFEYLPPTGNETDLNTDGEHTGDFRPEHGAPVTYRGNISVPNGQTRQQFYGEESHYTHTLLMDRPEVPISENGIIRWKGNEYDILGVHPSLNVLSVSLRRRAPDETEPEPVQEPAGDGNEDMVTGE